MGGQVLKELKTYRAKKDSMALMDAVLDVLRPPERQHLLAGFTYFIPKPERAWFAQCVSKILRPEGRAAEGDTGLR